jgi:hypothetical protein
MSKKLTIKLLLSALLFIVPIQKAFAVVPIGVAMLYSLAIHSGILAIAFNNDPVSVNLPSGSGKPITIYLDPNVPLIVPSGWTSPTAGVKPVPPVSSRPIMYAGSVNSTFATPAAAMSDILTYYVANPSSGFSYNYLFVSCTGTTCVYQTTCASGSCPYSNPTNWNYAISTAPCDAGYTSSGGVCVQSNPAIVRKPTGNPCEVIRTGNAIAVDSLNPSCDAANLVTPDGGKVTAAASAITINHPDGSVDSVTLNTTTGGATVVVSKPNSNGTTTTTTTDVSAPSGAATGGQSATPPNVDGQSSKTDNGTGTQAGSTSGTASGNASGSGSGNCNGGACATEATQLSVLGTLTNISQQMGNGFTAPSGQNPIADMQSGIDKMNTEPTKPTVSWIPSLLPTNSMACHPLPITMGFASVGTSATEYVDICAQLDIIQQFFGYLFMVGSTVYVFRCFSRGNQGS